MFSIIHPAIKWRPRSARFTFCRSERKRKMTKKAEIHHPGEGPFGEFFGFKLEELEPGRAVYSMDVSPKHFNPVNVLHGGVISSIVDQSMGAALTSALPKDHICATIEIAVHYFEAVRDGSIRVETKIVRQ